MSVFFYALLGCLTLLAGWTVLQIRIGADRADARQHEIAMARQLREDSVTKSAELIAQADLVKAETRRKEADGLLGYGKSDRTIEAYLRHHMPPTRERVIDTVRIEQASYHKASA